MVFGDPNSEPDDFNRPQDRISFFDSVRTQELQRDFDQERRDLEAADSLQRRDDERRMNKEAERRLIDAMKDFTVQDIRDIINDSNIKVTPTGTISSRSRPSGRDIIRRSGQFSRANILPPLKKPRKKNKKHCKNLSQCLRQANAELRTKKGSIRKGKSQADIMRRAQKLLRKMS